MVGEDTQTFAHNSSSDNCLPQFIPIKHRHENQKLKFCSEIYNNEEYNQLFTMEELRRSLNRSRDTAVGPDKIHYQFLKHLSESSLRVFLRAFNKIWQPGQIPSSWQEATIIPIPKPGKDHSNPTNYRPIALTSCICKTMERMVNDRLVWTLERERLISEYQCGFRRGRSTLDHLVRFETFLRNAFIRKQHAVAMFFDLEKVYEGYQRSFTHLHRQLSFKPTLLGSDRHCPFQPTRPGVGGAPGQRPLCHPF